MTFYGVVYDVYEYNGKTVMVLTTNVDPYYGVGTDDVLVYYHDTTNLMLGDEVSITGKMMGSYQEIEANYTISNYIDGPYSFTTSGLSNMYRMPVIKADFIE